jgi:hypothetical protein
MTNLDLVRAAGMQNETIDYALPQHWVDAMRKLGVTDPTAEYVWHYPKGSFSGVPLSIGELAIKAIARGAFVPQEVAYNAVEMGLTGNYGFTDIIEAIKEQCKTI